MSNPRTLDAELAHQIIRGSEQLTRHPEIGQSRSRGVAWYRNPKVRRLPFTTYKVDDTHVKVKGGMLMRGVQYADILIADSSSLTVADGNFVWLERTAANPYTWAFNSGAAYPTTMLYYPLATIAIDGTSHVLTVTLDWPGGHMVHDNILRVTLTNDGGDGGSLGTLASFTYTAKTDEASPITLTTGLTPKLSLARILPTKAVTVATRGTLHVLADGTYLLWDCDEVQTIGVSSSWPIPC